jgi:DNA-binding CsgD family transcriptional regulator
VTSSTLSFSHPLLRSAAYHDASGPDRRAAHRALAEIVAGQRLLDRRAWHLAAAPVGSDERTARELERAAATARARGAPAVAARAGQVAARLTRGDEQRARRLLQAGRDAYLAGDSMHSQGLLSEADRLADDPLLRAQIEHARGRVERASGSVHRSREMLTAAGRVVGPLDPSKGAVILADAAIASLMQVAPRDALHAARRAHALGRQAGGVAEMTAEIVLGTVLVVSGHRRQGMPLLTRAADCVESGALGDSPHLGAWASQALTYGGDPARGRAVAQAGIARARAHSAVASLPFSLTALCSAYCRLGDWHAASAAGAESVGLAEETERVNELTNSLLWLACVEAGQGREDACREHVEQATKLADRAGTEAVRYFGAAFLGLLELGLGRAERAVLHLQVAERMGIARGVREPEVARTAPDLVEAYARAGRFDDARRALERLEREAAYTEGAWALGAAARCRGLVAADDEFERHFLDALERQATQPFDRARTSLCYGMRLRRMGHRIDARVQLRRALADFEQLGADPWTEQARIELRASGERARRRREPPGEELTPQELQVALAVVGGATNREVAAALFLTPKTIEMHLTRIYRKLGVRSRMELARRLEPPPPAP